MVIQRTALRLRLNRLLSQADWRPPGMSPAAVVIVRHLSDPLPGQLAAQPSAVRAPPAWETAVQRQMANLYRRASRPYRGQLPPDAAAATAILFADEAEMMACLALDAARGLAGGRWWWQALRRARPTLALNEPAQLLQNQPRLVPAIFTNLHEWEMTAVVTAALSTAQAAALLTAVAQSFDLPSLPTAAAAPTAAPELAAAQLPSPPWASFLSPEVVPTTLPPAHTCLLGLSLSLIRRPSAVATPAFQRRLRAWWRAQIRRHARAEPDPAPLLAIQPVPEQRRAAPRHSETKTVDVSERRSFPHPTTQPPELSPDEPPPAASPSAPASPPAAPEMPSAPAPPQPVSPSNSQRATPNTPETAVSPDAGVSTQLGGVLYLVNLMVQMDIPACYEDTWSLASQVGAWGVLELLARSLLEPIPRYLQDDPIWAELAELDGRPRDSRLPDGQHALRVTDHAQWLAHVLPDVRAHLLSALRLEEPDRLAGTLLLVNGRLHVTTTHVDLVMRLEDVSLPVRLAGLDFDPGWQPAFGRVIQFHFD